MRGGFNHLNIAMAMKEHTICWWSESGFNHLDFWIPSWDGCGFWRRIFPWVFYTALILSVVLIVFKELLMWSVSLLYPIQFEEIDLVWGECFDTTYVGWVSYHKRGWVYWTFRRYDRWGSMYVFGEALEVVHNSGSHQRDEIIIL